MPIFEQQCNECNNVFEKLILNSEKKIIICPKCKSENVKKIISTSIFKIRGYSSKNNYTKRTQTDQEIINNGPIESLERMRDLAQ